MGYEPGQGEYRRVLLALFCAGLATFTQTMDVQAVLPELSRHFDISPATAALTVSATMLGVAVAVLPWSYVADRIGRVTVMKIGILVSGLVGVLSPLLPTFELLVAARFVLGLTLAALPAVAMAYIAEEISATHVAATSGIFVAGNSIGGLAGRLIAGFISEAFDWRVGLGAIALVTLGFGVLFTLVIPKPLGFTPTPPRSGPSVARIVWRHLRDAHLRTIYIVGGLITGSFAVMYNYIAYRLQAEPFHLSPAVTSLVFIAYLFGTLSIATASRYVQRIGRYPIVMIGIAIAVLGAVLSIFDALWAVLLGLVLFTAGSLTSHSVASGWVGQAARSGRAQATALYQLTQQTASALIGWAVGILFGVMGWTPTAVLMCVGLALAALAATVGLREIGGTVVVARPIDPHAPVMPGATPR